jgi:hypothetical protein
MVDAKDSTKGKTSEAEPTTADGKTLPLPRLSREQIDRLLKSLPSQTLGGREVMVPAFGGVAFYEGELRPETRCKPDSSEKDEREEEEIVYINTATVETTNESSAKQTKQQQHSTQQQQKQPTENEITAVSFSDAIEWLRKHSTVAAAPSTAQTVEDQAAKTTLKATAKASVDPSSKTPHINKQASSSPRPLPSTTSGEPRFPDNDAPAGPMFNINEEYSTDGMRIVGEAVNLSSRLKAVYGDDNPQNFNQSHYAAGGEESKTADEDAPFDPTLDDAAKDKGETPSAEIPTQKIVSDEDYDRIAKRLEELALMEEDESQRAKDGRKMPAKPLGGGGAKNARSKPKSSSSSFSFKKGFLNTSSSASSKKKAIKTKVSAMTATNKGTASTKNNSGGVTIDVSQNKVHEIPREGRQQPVPLRKPPPRDQAFVIQSTNTNNSNRLLDTSVFSGQISERKTPVPSPGVISGDVAARVAANEQTQNIQHELEQQQRQRQARPKRVSRFKQQRQQEQER